MSSLTVKQIEGLKVPKRYADGNGLYLEVKESGSKVWLFRYQFRGRRTQLGLGAYSPSNSLSHARKKCLKLNTLLHQDIDPKLHKDEQFKEAQESRDKKQKEEESVSWTLERVAQDWWEDNRAQWLNEKHANQNINTLRDYVFPTLGDKLVQNINVDDIYSVLKPIWYEKTETATRVRQRVERVLNYAKARGMRTGENPALYKNNLDNLLPSPHALKRKKALDDPNEGHYSAMRYEDVPSFFQVLNDHQATTAKMIQFVILTAMRTSTVVEARWDQVDLERSLWTIPAKQMKTKRGFVVPLASGVLHLLHSLTSESEYIFPSPNNPSKHMSNMAMLKMLKRIGQSDITVHGFRTSFRTWVAEQTNYGDLAEYALAHVVGSGVQRAYQRSDLLQKRAVLMEEWSRYVTGE